MAVSSETASVLGVSFVSMGCKHDYMLTPCQCPTTVYTLLLDHESPAMAIAVGLQPVYGLVPVGGSVGVAIGAEQP